MKKTIPWLFAIYTIASVNAEPIEEFDLAMNNQTSLEKKMSSPSVSELHTLAEHLSKTFDDGFQLTDLVIIVEGINHYLENNFSLSRDEKREAAIKTVCHIIDITDTAGVPDFVFDPLFKAFVPGLVAIMYPDEGALSAEHTILGVPTLDEIEIAIRGFFSQLSDGFTLDDIPHCICYATKFASAYIGLTTEEKAFAAKKLLAKMIDETDTPYLPDFIFDDIFKNLGNHIIDYLVKNKILQ